MSDLLIPPPQPTFSAPSFVQPRTYPGLLPQSIDALFNNYQQSKLMQAQTANAQMQGLLVKRQAEGVEAANIQGSADFALQHMGLSPQDVTQNIGAAMRPPPAYGAPAPGSMYATPVQQQPIVQNGAIPQPGADMSTQPPAPAPQPQMVQPGAPQPAQQGAPQQPQEDSKVTTLRNIMMMHLQGAQLGVAGQVAGIQKTQAEAAKAGAEAGLTEAQIKMFGGSSAVVDNFVSQIKAGKMTPDDLGNLGRGELANAIKIAVNSRLASQGADTRMLQNTADANTTAAKTKAEIQAQSQRIGTSAGTLEDVLNKVEPLISKLGPSQLKVLNNAWTQGLSAVNDPDASRVLSYLNEARGLYSQVLANGASAQAEDKAMASESIGHGLNPSSFAGMKEAVLFAAQRKMQRLQGQGYQEPGAPAQQQPVTRTLKNGQRVQVIPLGNGQYQQVQ